MLGLAVMVAVVLGAATMALAAAPGDPFRLGQNNPINNAITKLSGSNAGGPMLLEDNDSAAADSKALALRVEPGEAPLNVNADAGKATSLNADEVDGKGADQIGVNGLEVVLETSSAVASESRKSANAECPAGKVLVGTGFLVNGGTTGASPNELTDVTITDVLPTTDDVLVEAYEEQPTAASWSLQARAICATEGTGTVINP